MVNDEQIKIDWFKKPKSLSEIYQQTGMCFAFVTSPSEGRRVCHEWVKCRDFLHDAVRVQLTKKPCVVFGFTFNTGVNPPIDLKKMRMLVTKHDMNANGIDSFRHKMANALELVNHFEKVAKVSLTKLEEVDASGSGKPAVFLFTGSSMWMSSPFLVSMYTFLIRLGDKELVFKTAKDLKEKFKNLNDRSKAGELNDNDASYLGVSWDKMHDIITKRDTLFQKKDGFHDVYFKEFDINSFHNSAGLYNLSRATTMDVELNKKMKEIIINNGTK